MAHDSRTRKKAQVLYESGKSLSFIESKLKVSKRSLITWADAEKWEKSKSAPELYQKEQAALIVEAENAGITKGRYLKELALVGFSDMANHISIDDIGATRAITWEEMNQKEAGSSRVVKKIREKRTIRQSNDKSGDILVDQTFEFEFHDKLGALSQIGAALGFKTPAQESANEVTVILQSVRARHNK